MYLFSKRSYKDFLDVVTTLLSMDVIFLEPEKKTAFWGLPEIFLKLSKISNSLKTY